ncbi:6-O-methylguanine DNA methyltransferase [Aspergillus unguis]
MDRMLDSPASAGAASAQGGKASRRLLEDPLLGPHESETCDRRPGPASPQPLLHKVNQHKQEHKQEPGPDDDATDPSDTTSSSAYQHHDHYPSLPKTASATLDMDKEEATATTTTPESRNLDAAVAAPESDPGIMKLTKKITQHPTLTPHRKTLYLCLLSIPPGQWTTYTALAKHTGSSARAVGTAMRLNPFAPGVPCHRVLGADGGLGGYMGTPPAKVKKQKGNANGTVKGGKGNLEKKRAMLEDEGVRFDERGRAIGSAFMDFPS